MRRPVACAIDIVLVLVCAVVARAITGNDLGISDIALTAGPFVVGVLIGWAFLVTQLRRLQILQQGLVVWLDSWLIGTLLRLAFKAGFEWRLVLGSAVSLGVTLIGWRLIYRLATGDDGTARKPRKDQA